MIINIHGTIASGKTTLANNLRQFLKGAVGFDEPQINNPVLDLFYKDQKKWAFESQLSFFTDLTVIQQLSQDYLELEGVDYVINDNSQLGNMVFSELLVNDAKLDFYDFSLLTDIANRYDYNKPNVKNILLISDVDEVMANLEKRGRKIEMEYSDREYFIKLAENYESLFDSACNHTNCSDTVIKINIKGLNEKQVLQKVLDELGIDKKVERCGCKNANE